MLRRIGIHKGSSKLVLFSVPVALILLTDNILSFIVPIAINDVVSSSFLLGVIMGFSSLAGLFSDYLFPSIFKRIQWRTKFVIAMIMALFFPIISALGMIYSLIWIFVILCILWGVYYELLIFSEEAFIDEEEDKNNYSTGWSILLSLNVVTNIIGPVVGSALILFPIWNYTFILVGLVAIALIYTLLMFNDEDNFISLSTTSGKKKRLSILTNLFNEFPIWKEFLHEMAPLLVLGFMMYWVDMTMFVLGGVYGIKLVGDNGMEWIIIVLYNLPTVFITLFLLRNHIYKKKKLYATISLLLTGISFMLIIFLPSNSLLILIPIFLASLGMAFMFPFVKASISDIARRSGNNKDNVMGVYNAVGSLACIISPIVMGLVADIYGFSFMFFIMGIVSIIVAILLLFIMPRKILLNHAKLDSIESALNK